MRYDLGHFERENKIAGNLFCPGREHALFGHAIKGIIDLYRAEASRIEAKHFLGRDLFRIEFSFPFLVRIPACTDMDFHDFTVLHHRSRGVFLATLRGRLCPRAAAEKRGAS